MASFFLSLAALSSILASHRAVAVIILALGNFDRSLPAYRPGACFLTYAPFTKYTAVMRCWFRTRRCLPAPFKGEGVSPRGEGHTPRTGRTAPPPGLPRHRCPLALPLPSSRSGPWGRRALGTSLKVVRHPPARKEHGGSPGEVEHSTFTEVKTRNCKKHTEM